MSRISSSISAPSAVACGCDGGELPTTIAALKGAEVRPFLENPDTAKTGSIALWVFMFFTGLQIEQWNPRVRRPIAMPLLVIAAC